MWTPVSLNCKRHFSARSSVTIVYVSESEPVRHDATVMNCTRELLICYLVVK